jgi:hypothetical protein
MGSPTAPTQEVRGRPASGDTDNNLLRKIAAALATGAGLGGVDLISDSSAHDGDWGIFHALEDVVFTSVSYQTGYPNTGSLAGRTLRAGDRIFGAFKQIKLSSGSGNAYRVVQ